MDEKTMREIYFFPFERIDQKYEDVKSVEQFNHGIKVTFNNGDRYTRTLGKEERL